MSGENNIFLFCTSSPAERDCADCADQLHSGERKTTESVWIFFGAKNVTLWCGDSELKPMSGLSCALFKVCMALEEAQNVTVSQDSFGGQIFANFYLFFFIYVQAR